MAASGSSEVPGPWRESSRPTIHSSFLDNSQGAHVGNLECFASGRDVYKIKNVYNLPHQESTRENKESAVTVTRMSQWLNAPNFEGPYQEALAQRMPDTGMWFFGLPEFRQLVNAKGVVIWATGMPGSGKTVLSSASAHHLVESFKDHPDVATVFILLQYDDSLDTRDILASVLTQLLEKQRLIQKLMEAEYIKSKANPLNVI